MAAVNAFSARSPRIWRVVAVAAVVLLAVAAWAASPWWLRLAGGLGLKMPSWEHAAGEVEHEDHDHAGHAHGESPDSITLSDRALKNVGYRPATASLSTFVRTAAMPAIIIEKPGQSRVHLTSPVGGILTNIYVIQGEAIRPGSKLFEVRFTHEELVSVQQEYLKTVENLNVVDREIARLETLGEGVVAGRRVVEQQYEKQKLEAALRGAEQALLLHGLTEEQIVRIRSERRLLQSLTVHAPSHAHDGDSCDEEHTFHVQSISVSKGQAIGTNQEVAVLADHCELYIEGRAFEDDAANLREAIRQGWTMSGSLIGGDESPEITGLTLLYLADAVDPNSRAFTFYLRLPNEVVIDKTTAEDHRFIEWKFKPGQRLELQVPVEQWENRIVLPVAAVVDEGAEAYVYRQNGGAFERVSVHVEYRDAQSAVIANDGAVFPGDVVAATGAYQIHLALENRSGGGVDPHAGHHH